MPGSPVIQGSGFARTEGPGTDTTAIHVDVAGEIAAITEKTSVVDADLVLIEDSAAGNVKKRVQIGNIMESYELPLIRALVLAGW